MNKKRIFSGNFIMVLFLLQPFLSLTQTIHQLNEIIIEGESKSNAIKQQKEAGPATIILSTKEINNFGHHAAGDVIKRLPRMFVQGAPSFNRNVMMAGLNKEFQAVLIDGNRPAGGEDSRDFKLDRIPTEMIQSIDVVFNPPVSYGAEATIGLVNIKLKDTPDKQFVSTDLLFDFTSTKSGLNPNFNLAYGNKWNKWSLFASYNYNAFNRKNIMYSSDTLISGTDYEDVEVKINGLSTAFAYQADSSIIIKLNSFFTHYNENLQFTSNVKKNSEGELAYSADTANDDKLRLLHTHTLSVNKKFKHTNWKNSLSFAQHFDIKDRLRHQQKNTGLTISLEDEDQRNSELILESSISKSLAESKLKQELKLGFKASGLWREYNRLTYSKLFDRLFWDEIIDGSYSLNEYRAGVFVSDELKIGKLWVLPALRYDFDHRYYQIPSTNNEGSFDYSFLNPSLHMKYEPSQKLFLKADIARQIARPPFNSQVPVDKIKHKKEVIERGNPDLKPSTAWNVGLGTEVYFKAENYMTFRGFYSILRNVVETRGVGIDDVYGYKILQSVNVDSGLVWGFDVDVNFKLVNGVINQLNYSGNFSWLGSQVRDPGTLRLRRLNEQPEWMMNCTLDYLNTLIKTQFSVGLNYIGEREIAETTSDGSWVEALVYEPYLQLDARLKYFFTNWGSVYFNVNNLLNTKMDTMQGIVSESEVIGRNWIVGINLRF